MIDVNQYNGMTLAYIGDAIYELKIREHILSVGKTKVKELHSEALKYVSAISQARFMNYFLDNNILNETEVSIFLRGRNSHIKSNRKNVDLQTYLKATGFESLFGYLYLTNNMTRIEELLLLIYDNVEEENG